MNNSNLIILPGNSSENKEWAEKARDFFTTNFSSVTIQYYDHWLKGTELIDIDVELNKLINFISTIDGSITILAKSVGTILAMYAFYSKSIDLSHVTKYIFVGLPPEWARKNGFDIDTWSTVLKIPTILIQNSNDPVASAEEIRKEQKNGKFKVMALIELKGDDHIYGNFEEIGNYLLMQNNIRR